MNGNPNAAQKRFHTELREMFVEKFGIGELHHIFGSRRIIYKYEKAGEWLVVMLSPEDHKNINQLTFEQERELFMDQIPKYQKRFKKRFPVPAGLVQSYQSMRSRQQVMKGYSPHGDD